MPNKSWKFQVLKLPIFLFKSFGPLKAEATTSSGPTFLLLTEPDIISPYGLLSTLNPILIRKHFGFSETTPDEQIGRQCYQGRGVRPTAGFEPATFRSEGQRSNHCATTAYLPKI